MKCAVFLMLFSVLFAGCSGITVPTISEKQISEMSLALIDEHNTLTERAKENKSEEWIQPINKRESCKVCVIVDRGNKEARQVAWDGECKNGYAYGLGREFVTGNLIDEEYLSYYDGGRCPIEFAYKDNLNNHTFVGKGVGNKIVGLFTSVVDDGIKFNFTQANVYHGDIHGRRITIINSPLNDEIICTMEYRNFGYIYNISKNNTSRIVFVFRMITKDKRGFAYVKYRNGVTKGFEVVNNNVKEVKLPQSFISNINIIYNDIISKKGEIERAYREGLMAKEQYKRKINNSRPVDFMSRDKYFAILNEDRENESIKQKVNNALRVKQDRDNMERQIRAQEVMASAAIASSRAAQDQAAAMDRIRRQNFIDSMNVQNQLQNLNNNLFMMRMGY